MADRTICITGTGAVSPLGLTAQQLWHGICEGKSAIAPITAFDPSGFSCKLAGQAPEFKVNKFVPKYHRKATKLMSRDIELAVIAAADAVQSASLTTKQTDPENLQIEPAKTAINLGAGLISADLVELADAVSTSVTDGKFDIHKWGQSGMERLTPLWLLKYLPNMLPCHVGIIHDIQGPSNTITCGEAASHIAIAEAVSILKRGEADTALAGGGEAKVNPVVMLRQCLLKRATTENHDNPPAACRPFSHDAAGSVFGEAAGILVLETLQHAENRNAQILAQIVGTGQSNSLNPEYEHLEPQGTAVTIAIENALQKADIAPEDIDLIIPHGTAIPQDDLAEAAGIQNALGNAASKIPVLPIKSMTANTGAAAGALDIITAVHAIKNSHIPPAINCPKTADGINLNIIQKPANKKIRYAMCCGYTFGGQTAAVILKNPDEK